MKLFLSIALLMLSIMPEANAILKKNSNIYVAPVQATPESNQVYLNIVFPKTGSLQRKIPIPSQLRVEGYPLSTYSQFDRAKRIYNNPKGQGINVVIDNEPHFTLYVSHEDSFDENRNFLDKIVSFDIPDSEELQMKLRSGEHAVRVFPVRSFGESLKGRKAFDASSFYLGGEKPLLNIDYSKPFVTYNMPQGTYPEEFASPLLLDFIVRNCRLSRDGFKLRLTIDKTFTAMLYYSTPYYIYGLEKGEHTIRLDLLDKDDKVVDDTNALFNLTQRTIYID